MADLERTALIRALLGDTKAPSLADLYALPTPRHASGLLGLLQQPAQPTTILGGLFQQTEPQKRKVFFSFHFDDIMRVNNVRLSQEFKAKAKEVVQSEFYDRSLWESVKRTDPESLKRLIREGIHGTSVLCVMIGTQTWQRPWVRYEIARSVVDRKGLLAMDINSIRHHRERIPHELGPNPLNFMGVGLMADGTYRLFEKKAMYRANGWVWEWHRYYDYMQAVSLPRYLAPPAVHYVRPLSTGTDRYDYQYHDGWKNMGSWFDTAATRAGC